MSESHTLRRLGDVPITFEGDHLAEASGRIWCGREQNRFHRINLYRTQGGRYVVQIEYRTQWQGETNADEVHVCPDVNAARTTLRNHDPLAYVQGYPAGQAYEEKQRRLEQSLRMQWDGLLTELFGAIGNEFAEQID